MTQVTVSGFDTPSIVAARDAAGPGGTLFFPNGTYACDGLQATVQDQSWQLDRYAMLQQSANPPTAPLIALKTNGLRIRGGTLDGNNLTSIIDGTGSLDVEDVTVQNTPGWGFTIAEGQLSVRRSRFRNIRLADIFWNTNTTGPNTVVGPVIEDNVCDKSMLPANNVGSSILVHASNTTNTQFCVAPSIFRNRIIQPTSPTAGSSVAGIEFINCQRGDAAFNTIIGGGNGISLGNGGFMQIWGNKLQGQSIYAIELGGDDCICIGNTGVGGAPSQLGIYVNPASLRCVVANNRMGGYVQGGIVDGSGNAMVVDNLVTA